MKTIAGLIAALGFAFAVQAGPACCPATAGKTATTDKGKITLASYEARAAKLAATTTSACDAKKACDAGAKACDAGAKKACGAAAKACDGKKECDAGDEVAAK
jgi:hypothetical protein